MDRIAQKTRMEDILRTDISDLKPLIAVVFGTHWADRRCGARGHSEPRTRRSDGRRRCSGFGGYVQKLGLSEAAWRRFEQRSTKESGLDGINVVVRREDLPLGNPFFRSLRNIALKKTPDSVTQKQIQRIYSLESISDRS